jgi:hypothetical protein
VVLDVAGRDHPVMLPRHKVHRNIPAAAQAHTQQALPSQEGFENHTQLQILERFLNLPVQHVIAGGTSSADMQDVSCTS